MLRINGDPAITGARWTPEQVLSMAPDAASRTAGAGLSTAGPWSGAGSDGAGAVWGLCKGSGSRPYRTVVDLTGPAFSCSCPSRKFPCKHAVGLLLLWSRDTAAVGPSDVPDWAQEWLTARRGRAAAGPRPRRRPARAPRHRPSGRSSSRPCRRRNGPAGSPSSSPPTGCRRPSSCSASARCRGPGPWAAPSSTPWTSPGTPAAIRGASAA
ncbi:hypothetical protein EAO77_10635 [Streptomyces sp. t39]|nr:hypothetical protein EAO77_10635 [Streptomyces sp. t39]